MRAQSKGSWLPTRIRGIVIVIVWGVLGLTSGWRAAGEGGALPETGKDKETESAGDGGRAAIALGAELFHREWLPGDERSPGGDGLGPVYNDTSCVACHNLGAPGGGGPINKNIVLLNSPLTRPAAMVTNTTTITLEAFKPPSSTQIPPASETPDVLKPMFAFVQGENARLAKESAGETKERPSPAKLPPAAEPSVTLETSLAPATRAPSLSEKLARVHPGFLNSQSVVLHRFGTDPGYTSWRQGLLGLSRVSGITTTTTASRSGPAAAAAATATITNPPGPVGGTEEQKEMARLQSEARLTGIGLRRAVQVGETLVLSSERNATPLFGAGLIDAIGAGEIEAAAADRAGGSEFPEVRGRVSRLKDGRIGRFGWKGQMASLDDFVLNACAVELGLEVPDHPQAIDPLAPEAKAGGLDLTARDCAALTAYVASLPAPVERAPAGKQEAARIAGGRDRFEAIGCATCHRARLGAVAGIYSDLLLHDMGPSLADSGSYGVNSLDSPGRVRPGSPPPMAAGALRQEWRTPPLWGLRDSAPYLHDGRAATLEQAIASHGGEAQKTAQRFFALAPAERTELMTFLKSLVAPTPQLAGR